MELTMTVQVPITLCFCYYAMVDYLTVTGPEFFSKDSRCFESRETNNYTCPAFSAASSQSLGCFKTNAVKHQSTGLLAYSIQVNSTGNQLSKMSLSMNSSHS